MTFNPGIKKVLTVFSIFALSLFSVFADTDKWIVAGQKFVFTQDIKRSKSEEAVLDALPKLILEQLAVKNVRVIPVRELYDREMDELITKRLEYFLELSAAVKTRDSLVLQDYDAMTYNQKVNEQKKKISKIQKNIDKNLEEQEELYKKYNDRNAKPLEPVSEEIGIYSGTEDALFEFTPKEDGGSIEYQKDRAIINAKINGLVTGKVVTYGSYMAVTADLEIYPGGISTGAITEVGLISDPNRIATNIAMRLIPKIQNSLSCEVKVVINPPEYQNKTRLIIDSKVYNKIPEKLELPGGVHNITVDCDGFKRENFTYGFGYEREYRIEINLVKESQVDMAVVFKNNIEGNLFYRGVKAEKNKVPVTINQDPVIGYLQTASDNTIFYMVPFNQQKEGQVVMADIKDIDIGDYIEKRRRMMYISYSALICSLPFLFYSYGNFSSLSRGAAEGIPVDPVAFETYRTMSFVTIGISIGCGAWFIYELVRYLVAANKALPVQTYPVNTVLENAIWIDKPQEEEKTESLQDAGTDSNKENTVPSVNKTAEENIDTKAKGNK